MTEQIDILASYVPDIVVRRLLQDPTPIAKPRIDRLPAAIRPVRNINGGEKRW